MNYIFINIHYIHLLVTFGKIERFSEWFVIDMKMVALRYSCLIRGHPHSLVEMCDLSPVSAQWKYFCLSC